MTETGGDLSASSKHRTTGHTLRLCMELQTAVYLHILFDTCAILLRAGHQGSSLTDPHWPRVSVPLFSRLVANYSRGGTTPISWSPACTCINSVAIDLSGGLSC